MPLYHFHLADHRRDEDETGTELPDDRAARIEAVSFAGAYLRDNPRLFDDGTTFRVVVTDAADDKLFEVRVEVDTGRP